MWSIEDLNADILQYEKMIKRNIKEGTDKAIIKEMQDNLDWLKACKEHNHVSTIRNYIKN